MGKRFLNWSSGKDSAMALHHMQKTGKEIDLLLTLVSKEKQRIGLHGLSRELLEKQAKATGIDLKVIELEESTDHGAYEKLMTETCQELKAKGFDTAVFGDIFLEDLKQYRLDQLARVGLRAEFPLWKKNTKDLIRHFVDNDFEACIVSADAKYFDSEFLGRKIDKNFLSNLPKEVDPCGENGEFHSFCFAGPIFSEKISFEQGDRFVKTYPHPSRKEENEKISFHFLDLK